RLLPGGGSQRQAYKPGAGEPRTVLAFSRLWPDKLLLDLSRLSGAHGFALEADGCRLSSCSVSSVLLCSVIAVSTAAEAENKVSSAVASGEPEYMTRVQSSASNTGLIEL
ncbi:MAG: hypothetical protein PVG94_08155, partial [Gammaproteobacteria bacterium]